LKEPLKTQARTYEQVGEFAKDVWNILYANAPLDTKMAYDRFIDTVADKITENSKKPLSIDQISKLYYTIPKAFPISKTKLELILRPDRLPPIIREQMKNAIANDYIHNMYDVFLKKASMYDKTKYRNIVDFVTNKTNMSTFSPYKGPSPKKWWQKKSNNHESPVSVARANEKYVLVYVLGMGCGQDMDGVKEYQKDIEKYNFEHVTLKCNESGSNVIKNIIKVAIKFNPSKYDPFVQEILEEIKIYMKKDVRIILIGHSYGGAVVSRVAEQLNASIKKSRNSNTKLQVATFGSIYISEKKKVKNVNILNYMFTNDVVLKINGLHQPKKVNNINIDSNRVVWLNHHPYYTSRWDIHNDYNKMIEEVFTTKNIDMLQI
jgi:hypothetical protein